MKIRPISRVMTATALTNPDPSFVSVCTGPANQTPFHAVRSDDSINADVKPETDMKIKRSKAASAVVIAQKGYSVMQFAFDKNVFKTADDVNKFLADGGYEQTEMSETAKSFEVSDASGTKFEVGTTEVIRNAVPGVTAYVGKLAGATDEDQIVEDAEPAAPEGTSEVTQKADETTPRPDVAPRARTRTGEEAPTAPAEPEAPAEPAAPAVEEPAPAAEPEAAATGCTTGTCEIEPELAQKIDAILAEHPVVAKKISGYTISDLASVISNLRYIVGDADYSGIDDATVSNLKASAKSALAAMVSLVAQYSTEMTTVFKTDGTTVVRSDATVEEPAAPAATTETTEPAPDIAALVAKAVSEAVAPLAQQITDANAAATAAQTEASEARARAETAEANLAARVEADESRTQSRKAADDLDPPVSTTTTSTEKAPRSRASSRLLESFGSRHSR